MINRWVVLFVGLSIAYNGVLGTLLIPVYVLAAVLGFLWPFIQDDNSLPPPPDRNLQSGTSGKSSPEIKYRDELRLATGGGPVWQQSITYTGFSKVDNELNELIHYVMRDYVYSWYWKLSDTNADFAHSLQRIFQTVINQLTKRCIVTNKDFSLWLNFITKDIIEEITVHIRLYRLADQKIPHSVKMTDKDAQERRNREVKNAFFDLEASTIYDHTMCHDFLSMNDSQLCDYLRILCEAILFSLLPEEDFRCRPLRYAVRELVVNQVLRPMLDNVCSADFMNQCFVSWTGADALTSETFLELVKCSHSVEELDAIIAFAQHELHQLQSKDYLSAHEERAEVKQEMNSVNYLMDLCSQRIAHLHTSWSFLGRSGGVVAEIDQAELHHHLADPATKLSLHQILHSYHDEFHLFLEKIYAAQFLQFYDHAQAFRATVDEVLAARDEKTVRTNPAEVLAKDDDYGIQSSMNNMRECGICLLDMYIQLAQDLPTQMSYNFKLDNSAVKEVRTKLENRNLDLGFDWFDKLSDQVLKFMRETLYPKFLQSNHYRALFVPASQSLDDIASSLNEDAHMKESMFFNHGVSVTDYQISDSGKRHAVYEIRVNRYATEEPGGDVAATWKVYRRYSEFLAFYENLCKMYKSVERCKSFPRKKVTGQLDHKLLSQRQQQLNAFFQELATPEIGDANPGLRGEVLEFVGKESITEMAASVGEMVSGTVFNPLKKHLKRASLVASAIASVGNQNQPETVSRFQSSPSTLNTSSSTASLTSSWATESLSSLTSSLSSFNMNGSTAAADDSSGKTVQKLTQLTYEIFDLKGSNTDYLRQKLSTVLTSVVRATFGDRINKRINKTMISYMTEDTIAGYLKKMKDQFWPNGNQSLPAEPKTLQNIYRTKFLAKVKLYGSIPDEMKTVLGNDIPKRGVLRLVKLFQDEQLNRRLMVALFERFLKQIFPDLQMQKILNDAHQESSRVTRAHGQTPSIKHSTSHEALPEFSFSTFRTYYK